MWLMNKVALREINYRITEFYGDLHIIGLKFILLIIRSQKTEIYEDIIRKDSSDIKLWGHVNTIWVNIQNFPSILTGYPSLKWKLELLICYGQNQLSNSYACFLSPYLICMDSNNFTVFAQVVLKLLTEKKFWVSHLILFLELMKKICKAWILFFSL